MDKFKKAAFPVLIICTLVCAGIVWGCTDAAVDAPVPAEEAEISSPKDGVHHRADGSTKSSGFDTPEDYVRAMLVETTSEASLLQKPGSFTPSFKQTLSNLAERANALAKTDVEDKDPDALLAEVSALETDADAVLSRIQMPGGVYLSAKKVRSLIPEMIAQFPHLKEFDQSDWRSLYAEVISPIVSSPQGVLDCEELSASVANASLVIASAAFLTAVAGCAYLVLPPLIIGCTAVAMAAYIASAVLITSEYYLCVMECQEDECVSNCPSGQ